MAYILIGRGGHTYHQCFPTSRVTTHLMANLSICNVRNNKEGDLSCYLERHRICSSTFILGRPLKTNKEKQKMPFYVFFSYVPTQSY